MKGRYWLLAGLLVALIIAILLINRDTKTNNANEGIKVATIINLTGPSAQFDAVKKRTIELAVELCKKKAPTTTIDYLLLDGGSSTDQTKVAVQRALAWKADVILSGTSPTALAIANDVRQQKRSIIQIANAANPAFGPPHKYEFRFWPDWNQESLLISKVIGDEKYQKILLIYSADPYSEALAQSLRQRKLDATLNELKYDPSSTTDFRPYLIRAKEDKVNAIIIFGLPPGIKSFMSQLSNVNWQGDLIGGVNINLTVDDFDKNHLQAGLWVLKTESMLDSLRNEGQAQQFRSAYKAKYNETPPFHSLYLADAIYWIANSNTVKSDSLIARMTAATKFDGPSGLVNVNNDGSIRLNIMAQKIRGKNLRTIN